MKAAPHKGSRTRLTHTPQEPPTSEALPVIDIPEVPDMDSGEFDARMAREWARLALAVRP